ncbi:MAG: tRNA preQ1(34) S-adenosylmethionine ribosyltransferase-isomerase QueA [Armatimonadetes bacterium]|nr:tRNA preQ1(34) S-adenosylmethionine ribosyltransferase-isomerase QueA [Armatimonadota bacterium]
MRLSEFDYDLPPELIAQEPLPERDKSRLLVLFRKTGRIEHRYFYNLPEYLNPGDLLVMNNTRVTAKRLRGVKPTGGKVEALLLHEVGPNKWEALVKPGRRVEPGTVINFGDNLSAEVIARTKEGGRILDFGDVPEVREAIERIGEVPLPPYIKKELRLAERYQTVYAQVPGSAAAPTAGLHFTPRLISKIREKGVEIAFVTLNVGVATFRPVKTELIAEHPMHREMISVSPKAAEMVNSAKGRIIAVGTTTARALESAAVGKRKIQPMEGETGLYIIPGYEFKVIDGLITNFHMPRSTLLILVSAFAGRDNIMRAYEEAKRLKYRFLSFGDAMLIV